MAICTTCGAASAVGAAHCAACGAAFTAVRPGPEPAAGPAIGEVEFEGGHAGGPEDGPRPWGGGRVVAPRRWSRVLDLVADPDWLPALKVVAAPTALLLLAGLLLAFGLDDLGWVGPGGADFASRYGVGLAAALTAFGGPLSSASSNRTELYGTETALTLQVLPMTVTLLWALLFGFGLRRWAGPAVRHAVRAVLLAVLTGGLLALLSGVDQIRTTSEGTRDYTEHVVLTAGQAGPLLGTAVLAALVAAWTVRGAPALRERAPLWWASVVAAARGAGLTVGLSALAALVVLAVVAPWKATLAGLLALPNLGLTLLGFGAGAGLHLESSGRDEGGAAQNWTDRTVSLVDLEGWPESWRLAVLLVPAVLALLTWSVRRLERPVRLRAAALLWPLFTALTAVAGAGYAMDVRMPSYGQGAEVHTLANESAAGMGLLPLLTVHLLLVALGVLAVPELLDRLGGRDRPARVEGPDPEAYDPAGLELTASSGYLPPQGGEVLDFGKR
ncbi:hypothetical protein ACWCYY_21835 [Kitasatospora sp. NPDC001664]